MATTLQDTPAGRPPVESAHGKGVAHMKGRWLEMICVLAATAGVPTTGRKRPLGDADHHPGPTKEKEPPRPPRGPVKSDMPHGSATHVAAAAATSRHKTTKLTLPCLWQV